METRVLRPVPDIQHAALKPSLVEWKPVPGIGEVICTKTLETFLSGMETAKSAGGVVYGLALKPSLVEWKQKMLAAFDVTAFALKPSLVEWKRVSAFGVSSFPASSLETFLSGMETG